MAQWNRFLRGARSSYATSIDNYGELHTNNTCDLITAERYNFIGDTIVRLQYTTQDVLHTGASFFTHAVTGTNRPKVIIKPFTISIVGGGASLKTATSPAPLFTAAEKALFSGTPLASGQCIHVQVRRVPGDSVQTRSYLAAVQGPIADTSGDSGVTIGVSLIGSGLGNVEAGTYVVTMFITSNNE